MTSKANYLFCLAATTLTVLCAAGARNETATTKRPNPAGAPAPAPYGTNAFWYLEGQVRVFAVDWHGLTLGHTYELQSSQDGRTWRRRLSVVWGSADPAAYWGTRVPMFPATPEGLTIPGLFRLVDVTP
jgi:hypothetical protein